MGISCNHAKLNSTFKFWTFLLKRRMTYAPFACMRWTKGLATFEAFLICFPWPNPSSNVFLMETKNTFRWLYECPLRNILEGRFVRGKKVLCKKNKPAIILRSERFWSHGKLLGALFCPNILCLQCSHYGQHVDHFKTVFLLSSASHLQNYKRNKWEE